MTDKDVILSKINIIKNCITAIERAAEVEKDRNFLLNIFEINLQRAIQACIDMANVVIAKEALGLPNTYRQAFEILANHAVIPDELRQTMVAMVGFRNISVHDYSTVKPEIIHAIVKNHLSDFERYYSTLYKRAMNTW